MKSICMTLAASILVLASGAAAAAATNVKPNLAAHVLPVLVRVNASGEVSRIEPIFRLRPAQQRGLEATIERMVTGPATDANGRAMRSQFVMFFGMQPNHNEAGTYTPTYMYSRPAQDGLLHWVAMGSALHARYGLAPAFAPTNSIGTIPVQVVSSGSGTSGGSTGHQHD